MIIIDIGAYDGKPYLDMAREDKNIIVYAFEPNQDMANDITENKPDNYKLFPMAVSETNGLIDFYENELSPTSSILKFDEEVVPLWNNVEIMKKLNTVSATTVESIRLDTFIANESITKIDFLKIDAQGADLKVLRSCGDMLKIVEKIKIEVMSLPIYKGGDTAKAIYEFLNKNGFKANRRLRRIGQSADVTFKKKQI